jgi:hypothetical protein
MAGGSAMFTPSLALNLKKRWPWLVIVAVFIIAAWVLRSQGRQWWCSCGQFFLWAGDIWSEHNSQHLADPYSFTHILHGFVFCWLLVWIFPRLKMEVRLMLALVVEAAWELFENSEFVIQRYREATLALGYQGDSIINSLSDIMFCGLGVVLARYLGFRRTLVLFVITELVLIFWIRDSLILNIIMLIYPLDAIKTWQMGH